MPRRKAVAAERTRKAAALICRMLKYMKCSYPIMAGRGDWLEGEDINSIAEWTEDAETVRYLFGAPDAREIFSSVIKDLEHRDSQAAPIMRSLTGKFGKRASLEKIAEAHNMTRWKLDRRINEIALDIAANVLTALNGHTQGAAKRYNIPLK